MNVVQVGNTFQVRDERGRLEVTTTTRAEAVAWIGGYRMATDRARQAAKSAADVVTMMARA